MITQKCARFRWLSVMFIGLAAGLLVWGDIVFAPYLQGFYALVYWTICLTLTALAVVCAGADAVGAVRRTRAGHRVAFQRLMGRESVSRGSSKSIHRNS